MEGLTVKNHYVILKVSYKLGASFLARSHRYRKLEKNLTILGTIGGVAPFLGLFGTVVRILYTFLLSN